MAERMDHIVHKKILLVFKNSIKYLSFWGVLLGFALVLISLAIKRFGLDSQFFSGNELYYNLAFISAMILFLSAQITGIKTEILDKFETQDLKLREIQNTSNSPLITLQEVVRDINVKVKNPGKRVNLVVNHLGLDMSTAWDYIEQLLLNINTIETLEYNVLILKDDIERFGSNTDPEVLLWCKNAREISIPRMANDIKRISAHVRRNGGKMKFTCKGYAYVPFVHGIKVTGSVNACYMSLCRWGGDEYDRFYWGHADYYQIANDTTNSISQDLVRVFDGTFFHHWNLQGEKDIFEEC